MSFSVMNPSYSFLSKPPPPPQKRRPLCPPPPTPTFARKRSSTFSAIAAWAAHVQPGSPSTPRLGPHTSSFLVVDTPSPNPKDFAIDLTGLGYTSVFVHLPNTPSPVPMASKPTRPAPGPLKRFRSLSILRPRNNTPATPAPPPSPSPYSPKITAVSIAKRKKAVYTHAAPPTKPKPKPSLPPSLASELALLQFADGGSTEDNIKRLMVAQARAAAPAGANGTPAVGDVYRDGKGGVWWDREEEMEYVHLLSGHPHDGSRDEKWVSFGGEVREGKGDEDADEERGLALASLQTDAGYGRRGSANSIGSVDICNVVKPAEEDAKLVKIPLPAPAPRRTPEPILTIPSRPRRGQHHHLRPSSNFFLLDLNAFVVPRTPSSESPCTPTHPQLHSPTPTPTQRRRGAARRRPAPLNIVAHVPVRGVSPVHEEDENENEDARKDFLDASFTPVPVPAPEVEVHHVPTHTNTNLSTNAGAKPLKKKTSRNLLSLFGRK